MNFRELTMFRGEFGLVESVRIYMYPWGEGLVELLRILKSTRISRVDVFYTIFFCTQRLSLLRIFVSWNKQMRIIIRKTMQPKWPTPVREIQSFLP